MGLAERRAVKQFEDSQYPKFKAQIDKITGWDVPVEVDWNSLAVDDYGHMYNEAFEKVYFLPLIEALKGVCVDDMGKDALRDGLKKIIIRYGGASSDISYSAGVLKFDHHPVTNLDYWGERKQEIQRVLEKHL